MAETSTSQWRLHGVRGWDDFATPLDEERSFDARHP